MQRRKFDIYVRASKFTVRTIKFLERMPKSLVVYEYSGQLIRSSGSIGANLEEADGALSKKDFINKLGISRREASECRHGLKLIEATVEMKQKEDSNERVVNE